MRYSNITNFRGSCWIKNTLLQLLYFGDFFYKGKILLEMAFKFNSEVTFDVIKKPTLITYKLNQKILLTF